MINEEYINEKRILGHVANIDPIRYRKNKSETPVLNAVIETKRIYGRDEKIDRHKIAIFGEAAHDFYDKVREGDYVLVHGYSFTRERKYKDGDADVQVIEDTLCAERWIPITLLTEEPI